MGVAVAAATVCGVMLVLNKTYGFVGDQALVAPQANAMAAVIDPLMNGIDAPWALYAIGAVIAIFVTYGLYSVVYDFLISSSMNFINGYLIRINDILGTISTVFISMGIGIGTVGSVISVRRYLEV